MCYNNIIDQNMSTSIKLFQDSAIVRVEDKTDYDNQKNQEIKLITDEVDPSIKYKTVSSGRHLFVGPSEVFFNSVGSLSSFKSGSNTDDLNQNKKFSYITGIKNVGDSFIFPLYFSKATNRCNFFFNLELVLDNSPLISVKLGELFKQDVRLSKKPLDKYNFHVQMKNVPKGYHELKIKIKENPNPKTNIFKLNYIRISAGTLRYVVREIWRPLACHISFSRRETPQSNPSNNLAWIMEMEKLPSLSCFSPLDAPFGYYGPIMDENGKSSGVNFSLWSFGRNDSPPPIERFSRILAIGSPKGSFGEFTHEGTGVKIRNYNPWNGTNVSQKYVVALKFEDIGVYVNNGKSKIYRFFSYFWNEVDQEWNLYGIGEKALGLNVNSLSLSSFIEVPGIAENQRTNHIKREVIYKGYVLNHDSNTETNIWNRINTMKPAYNGSDLTNKRWSITEDNYFKASCGGLEQKKVNYNQLIRLPDSNEELPSYMSPEKLAFLNEQTIDNLKPTILSHEKIQSDTGKWSVKFNINIPFKNFNNDTNTVELHYGNNEGLTIERLWDNKQTFTNQPNGDSSIKLTDLTDQQVNIIKFARVLVKDNRYQFWSFETHLL